MKTDCTTCAHVVIGDGSNLVCGASYELITDEFIENQKGCVNWQLSYAEFERTFVSSGGDTRGRGTPD